MPRCVPQFVTLAQAQQRLPHLIRAAEIPFNAHHLAWAPLNDMPCWTWVGWLDEKGFARMQWGEQRSARVHRVVFTALRGDPGELVLDHLCRNRACVNPWHLQPVTQAVNTQRGARAEGVCRNGLHEMVGDNVIVRERGGFFRYECRACKESRR